MYNYNQQKANIFTEQGSDMFIKIRDRVHYLLNEAGAFTMIKAIKECSGDSWDMLACVDRLVEMGEIREVTDDNVAGQHRVFVSGRSSPQ